MGTWYSAYIGNPEATPNHEAPPSFDPLYGFPNGRKERKMIATEEDMRKAKIHPDQRDFCAHLLINYKQCRQEVWPFTYKCAHEKHAYGTCQYEDYVLRMKEFERERRLRLRQQRIEARERLAA